MIPKIGEMSNEGMLLDMGVVEILDGLFSTE
jgi:hypothetical protein